MTNSTVSVTPITGRDALLLSWEHRVDKDDVRTAFADMTQYLHEARRPLYVIVDLRKNPVFPLAETITACFWGPFRHTMLAEWLVVGSSPPARTIGRTLVGISRRDNIRWLQTMEQAEEYLVASVSQVV